MPLAASYFAIGILSRLAYSNNICGPQGLSFAAALAIVLLPFQVLRPFLVWMVVFFGLSDAAVPGRTLLGKLYALVLESPLALYFGARSYSIYLCHYPVISCVAWLLFRWSVPSSMPILTMISIPLIILTADLAYRWIEKPGIAAGRILAAAFQRRQKQPVWQAKLPRTGSSIELKMSASRDAARDRDP